MNLAKVFPIATERNGFNSNSAGIFEVKLERQVTRTYSNGLSYKHVPRKDRWRYKVAVAERVRQLGVESAKHCQKYAPNVISLFCRWRELKEEWKANWNNDTSLIYTKLKAFAELLALPEVFSLEPLELYEKIETVVEYREPKFLAAKFADLCKNRSNLGQSSFLRLVGAGRGYLEATEKLQWVRTFFQEHPDEFSSFLLFGRAPWTESTLSRHFQLSFSWARNFLVGIRNKFMFELDKAQVTLPKPSLLLDIDFNSILEPFEFELRKKCETLDESGADSTRVKSFLRAIKKLREQPRLLTEPFRSKEVRLTWKTLKNYSTTLQGISFSALRTVFVRACLHQKEWSHAVERCIRRITPELTLKKPFHERVSLKALPIDLVMGKKYVIYRPGNANKMRELLLKEGIVWFEVPKVSVENCIQTVRVCWHAPKRVSLTLQKGAKIRLFRFLKPQGPGKAIKVSIVLSGAEACFLGTSHLAQERAKLDLASKELIGLDTNRLSEYIFTAPFDFGLTSIVQAELNLWHHLESVIGGLQKKAEATHSWKHELKLKTEIRFLHRRRANLRSEILKKTRIHLGALFTALKAKYIALEAELHKDTKDKKGGLAKAISGMPNNLEVISREVLLINEAFKRNLQLVLVRKEGTSQFHNGCGGTLDRTGDDAVCRKCGAKVNSHENSARNVEERALKLVEEYTKYHLQGGAPSAC